MSMQGSPNKRGVMGSKSVGEPPLLLSTSVLTAFQSALAAAKADLRCRGCGDAKSGTATATVDQAAAEGERCVDTGDPAAAAKPGQDAQVAAGRKGPESDGEVSAWEEAVVQLCAPVTVKAVRSAVGDLSIPAYLEGF